MYVLLFLEKVSVIRRINIGMKNDSSANRNCDTESYDQVKKGN